MAVTIKLEGIDKTMQKINKHLEGMNTDTKKVFFEFYVKVRQDCMTKPPTVPKDTGNLRNSMFFTYSEGIKDGKAMDEDRSLISRCQSECRNAYIIKKPLSIIGFAANYAVYVHEKTTERCKEPGSGPKFFETHLQGNANYFNYLIKKNLK